MDRRGRLTVAATVALAVAFLWLGLLPTVPAPFALLWDKLEHAGGYLLLAVLASMSSRRMGLRRPWLWGFGFAVIHGALLEVLQGMTPTRDAEMGDMIADAIGAATGVSAWLVARAR